MKKKFVAVILAAVMALSVCACGKEAVDQKSTNSSQKTEESSSETESAQTQSSEVIQEEKPLYPIVDEPITIRGAVMGTNPTAETDRILWDKIAEVTGITVEWEFVDPEAFAVYLASNDWPDIFHCQRNMTPSLINDYGIVGGRFVDFTEYLDIMPNLEKTYEDYPLLKKAVTETNGAIYNPGAIEISATNVNVRAHTRMDVLESAGITKKPETTEEFYNALKALYEKNGSAGMLWNNASVDNHWVNFLFAAFGPLVNIDWDYDEEDNMIFSRTTEQYKHYLEFMNKLYEEKLIHQEYLTLSYTESCEIEKNGTIAFLLYTSSSLKKEDFLNGEWGLDVLAPLTSEYDDTREIQRQTTFKLDRQLFVDAKSEYVEEICKMLDILYATEEVVEGSGLFGQSGIYGLEGQQWQRNDDMTYSFILPEGYDGSFGTYQNKEVIFYNLGRGDALNGYITDTPGNNQERQKAYVENVHPYATKDEFPASALKFTDDEQYVLDNKFGEIKSYYEEMYSKFVTGVADIETEWDEYCSTIETMGIQEVVDIYQDAFDRFNK